MRRHARRWCCWLWLLACAPLPAAAQVLGTAFSYQGVLEYQGQPASGIHDLQFTPYATVNGTTPLLPALTVQDVQVTNGQFSTSVDFGNALFLGDNVYLQIGVRPGASTGTFQTLLPRVAVQAAPYALKVRAASVTDIELAPASVTSAALADSAVTAGKIANGAVGAGQLGVGSVGSPQIADGSVGAAELAAGAVTAAVIQDGQVLASKLADAAVNGNKLADGAVSSAKLAPSAVVTDRIADAAVSRAKLAPGAVGLAQVDSSVIQARIAQTCPYGHSLRGVQSDGAPVCNPIDAVADSMGDVGSYPSIEIGGDSRALVSYFDASNTALKLHSCHDLPCTSGDSRVLDDAGDVGRYTQMAMRGDLRMVIAYSDAAAGLKLYVCADARCTSGAARVLDPTPSSGRWPSIGFRADGRPLIAHYAATGGDLRLYDCNDADCTTGTARVLDSIGDVGNYPSLMVQGALVLISYHDTSNGDLKLYTCANAACSAGASRVLDNSPGTIGRYTNLLQIFNAFPVVLYQDASQGRVKAYGCSNYECSAGMARTIASPAGVQAGTNLRANHNYLGPTFAYLDPVAQQVRLVNCADAHCSGDVGDHHVVAGDVAPDVSVLSIAVAYTALGHLAIYDRTDGLLRLRRCGNYGCE